MEINKNYEQFTEELVYKLAREQEKRGYTPAEIDFFEDFEALTALASDGGLISLLNQSLGYYLDLFPQKAAEFRSYQAKQIKREEKEALLALLMELSEEETA